MDFYGFQKVNLTHKHLYAQCSDQHENLTQASQCRQILMNKFHNIIQKQLVRPLTYSFSPPFYTFTVHTASSITCVPMFNTCFLSLDPPRYSAAVKLVTAAKHIKLMCRMGISSLCASNLIELTFFGTKEKLCRYPFWWKKNWALEYLYFPWEFF